MGRVAWRARRCCWISHWAAAVVCAQVNPSIVGELESHGMTFVGHDVNAQRMEIMELQGQMMFAFCLRFTQVQFFTFRRHTSQVVGPTFLWVRVAPKVNFWVLIERDFLQAACFSVHPGLKWQAPERKNVRKAVMPTPRPRLKIFVKDWLCCWEMIVFVGEFVTFAYLCRSPILRWRPISSGVFDTTTEAVTTVPRPRARCMWQADVVRGTWLSLFTVQQIQQQRRSLGGGGRCSHSGWVGQLEPAS